ncbi:DUF2157 domain-containing protein [Paenibacillus chartarius]|uniref:DUF2157 domain-containing protein n=1 Tax=Paenibacillus chartarius TaxID=747481 RepID=A0ABV6DS64_9BACL
MSRRFVETEGRRWIEHGIITPEQHEQIIQLYPERKRAIGFVPLFGSILVGLGILSFVAANWQGIPELLRLALMIAVMSGFYFTGHTQLAKGHDKLGVAFIALGLTAFGSGIILTAQMFHLEAYNAFSWIAWATAGLLLTYLYNSRFLYAISALLYGIAQFYSSTSFHQFSYAALFLSMVGLGYFAWSRRDRLPVWLFGVLAVAQSIMLIGVRDWKFIWVFVPAAVLYTLGDLLGGSESNRQGVRRLGGAFYPLQTVALIAAFLFDWFIVVFADPDSYRADTIHDLLPDALPFLIPMAVLLALSLLAKARSGRAVTAADWLLFPVLMYFTAAADAIYMIILFVFSLYQLWLGYHEESRLRVNLATVLFLISTMTAYGKLTWDFMDKSLFFIIGGALLLAISWVLNRRKRDFFRKPKGGADHVD